MTARRFGSVRQLSSGRFQARRVGPDGVNRPAPSTFASRDEAEAWLARERDQGAAQPRQPGAGTFGDYAESWLHERDLTPRSRAHYRRILDRFLLPAFADQALSSITAPAVRRWHAGLRPQTGPTMLAHAYSMLRTILNTAVTDGEIASNPCQVRGAGSARRVVTIRPATLDELTQITTAMPEALRLIVPLAAWCALRFGELAELRRRDVDVDRAVLHVRRGVTWVNGETIVGRPKSAAGVRDVSIPPHLLPAIALHLAQHARAGSDGLLFSSPNGGNLTTTVLYASWLPAREAAGRPDLRFHDLRHTGAVLAAAAGATLADLMSRLGHSTPAAAMRYQHASHARDRDIAAALSGFAESNVVSLDGRRRTL